MGPYDYKQTPEMFMAYIDTLVTWFEAVGGDGEGGWSPAFEGAFKRLLEREIYDNAIEFCSSCTHDAHDYSVTIAFKPTRFEPECGAKFTLNPKGGSEIFYAKQNPYKTDETILWKPYERRRL
jgi:hypothetical protein